MDKSSEYQEFYRPGTIVVRREPGPGDDCVIEGTKVLLYDGSEKNIEDIIPYSPGKDGDRLINLEGSITYPVAAIVKPNGSFPVIDFEIETSLKKYNITVSISHGFFRSFDSIVNALYLNIGDKLITRTGEGIVRSNNVRQYTGNVWNIYLADKTHAERILSMPDNFQENSREHSMLGLSVNEQSIFTNEIASGSLIIQKRMISLMNSGIKVSQLV